MDEGFAVYVLEAELFEVFDPHLQFGLNWESSQPQRGQTSSAL